MFNPDDYANDLRDAESDDILDIDGPSDEEIEAMMLAEDEAFQSIVDDLDETEEPFVYFDPNYAFYN